MPNVLVRESSLQSIADAIRAKNGTQNTYKPDEMADAIEAISGGGITPTGTIEITQNGVVDVTNYASADVDVPTGSTPVINSLSITENGTYTAPSGVDGYSPVTVSVSGYTAADFADQSKPIGEVTFLQSSLSAPHFYRRTGITKLYAPNFTTTGNVADMFKEMTGLQYAIFPKCVRFYNTSFYGCSNLEAIDCTGGTTGGSNIFANCTKLNLIILRKSDGIAALNSNNAFNNTPFASGKAGGTIYIPKVLYDALGTGTNDYKAAANWSTIDGYGTITWAQIEGSYYETHYADGTPIPTE